MLSVRCNLDRPRTDRRPLAWKLRGVPTFAQKQLDKDECCKTKLAYFGLYWEVGSGQKLFINLIVLILLKLVLRQLTRASTIQRIFDCNCMTCKIQSRERSTNEVRRSYKND